MSRLALLLVFAVALGVRAIVLVGLRDDPLFGVLVGDARVYDAWALEIAGGNVGGGEVFYQAPLYPYFMGAVYAVFGHAPLVVRGLQVLLGALSCVLVAKSAARLVSPAGGVAAGFFLALYVPAIAFDVQLQKTSLALFLTALLVDLLARQDERPRPGSAVAAGAVLGLLVLTRENALVLALPAAAWIAFGKSSSEARRLHTTGLFATAFVLVLLPVGLRNAVLGGTFLPTASNAGVNFYIGNGPGADGLYRPLVAGRGHADYEAEDARRLAEAEVGHALSPAEVSRFWFDEGRAEVLARPVEWAGLLARKAYLLLNRTEIMDAESLEVYRDRSFPLAALGTVFHFGVLFPLAAAGMVLLWSERERLWPLTMGAAFLAASIVLFFVVGRFRIGLLPFLLPFAAATVVELPRRWRAGHGVGATVTVVLAALLANLPDGLPGSPRGTTYANLSSEFHREGDWVSSERWAREALAHDPGSADAHFNLGVALRQAGEPEEAELHLARALELQPGYAAEVKGELGVLRAMQDDLAGAIQLLEESVALAPGVAGTHLNLGLSYRGAGRMAEAVEQYEIAERLDPDDPAPHHNLGYLRELQGDAAAAAEHYRAALEIEPDYTRALWQLAWILATSSDAAVRDGAEALRLADRSLRLAASAGEDEAWDLLDLRAAALAEGGDFEGALAEIERAFELAPDDEARAILASRRASYAEGLPLRR